jgi:hypothetical protein
MKIKDKSEKLLSDILSDDDNQRFKQDTYQSCLAELAARRRRIAFRRVAIAASITIMLGGAFLAIRTLHTRTPLNASNEQLIVRTDSHVAFQTVHTDIATATVEIIRSGEKAQIDRVSDEELMATFRGHGCALVRPENAVAQLVFLDPNDQAMFYHTDKSQRL